eukprot:Gb_05747 [translate_table: standard]
MAASCFSMATTQVHLNTLPPPLEASATSSSCAKASSSRLAMMAMAKPVSYSLEVSHARNGISCLAPVLSRRRLLRITALAQEAPLAAEVVEEQEAPLTVEVTDDEEEGVPEAYYESEEGTEATYESEEQLEVPEAVQEGESEVEGESEPEGEVEGSYDQDFQPIPEGTKVYVGNLPFDIDSEGLAKIFEESGIVEMSEVIYDRATGRSRGFAFVTMSTVEEAEAAIEKFNNSQIGGRYLRVNFPEVPRGGDPSRLARGPRGPSDGNFVDSPHKVYAGNLAWSVTSETLREAFSEKGNVLGARVVLDRETGRSRGFGFVSFSSQAEVEAAVSEMDGMELEGREIRVNVAMNRRTEDRSYGSEMQNY